MLVVVYFLKKILNKDPLCCDGGHIRGLNNNKKPMQGELRKELFPIDGIIWLCLMPDQESNLEFNKHATEEAECIKEITGAKVFKGHVDDFFRTIDKHKNISWVHFIGHGGISDSVGNTSLYMTNKEGQQQILEIY